MTNWRRKGRLLNKHRPPSQTPDGGVVTSVAIDHEWIVVGLASCRIQVFSARTGVLSRTLTGHESGVWAVNLVSAGGKWVEPSIHANSSQSQTNGGDAPIQVTNPDEALATGLEDVEYHVPDFLRVAVGLDKPRPSAPEVPEEGSSNDGNNNLDDSYADQSDEMKPSDICCSSEGWGQPNALVVSGGCDKELRVWDVKTGHCIYVLRGHTSTIRCMRVLHNRPIAVSGSRDTTLRVWDVQRGRLLRTLTGHDESVRCLDVCGNQAVSGSYDCTCRVRCVHIDPLSIL